MSNVLRFTDEQYADLQRRLRPRVVATVNEGAETAQNGPRRVSAKGKATLYPLVALCLVHGLPAPIPEYRFNQFRRWRFDYAWPLYAIACEIEGGIWIQGRHTRGAGALADMEKYNSAAIDGWRVLRYTPDQLTDGNTMLRDLRRVFNINGEAA